MKGLVRRLRRSLAASLVLLVAAFIAVPIPFYLTFEQVDQERQEMLLGSIQAQGRLVAAALQPMLARAAFSSGPTRPPARTALPCGGRADPRCRCGQPREPAAHRPGRAR